LFIIFKKLLTWFVCAEWLGEGMGVGGGMGGGMPSLI
jgi:hypothetical protein